MTIEALLEMKKDLVRVGFPPKLYEKAKKQAEFNHINTTAYMRQAVARTIEADEKKRERERHRVGQP